MTSFHRRVFLQRTAILGATAATLGFSETRAADEPAKASSANDKLRVAVVGVRSRGMNHIGTAEKGKGSGYLDPENNTEIVAVCDADEGVIGNAMKKIKADTGKEPKFVQDFRKLLDDKSIDIISIATPNHWHATMAVWAMRAGKHVYCEKPATHNVHEGRLMTEAMAKHKVLCQVGTQSRSNKGMQEAIKYIHDGKIGTVKLAYGSCYKPRKSIGKVDAPTEPMKSINYDLWCGPAAMLPVKRKQLHYDWHWTWEYGNGDYGNQGVHEADKARWGLGVDMPKSIVAAGGRFGYVDDGETPNTMLNLYEFDDNKRILFEVRGLDTKDYKGAKVGNIWFGDKGYVVCPSYSGGVAYDPDGKEVARFSGGGDQFHFRNFVKAIRSGKAADLTCPALEGHYSAALCHLGNISYRLGAEAPIRGYLGFSKVPDADNAFDRMMKHLEDNKVDTSDKGMLGVLLKFDPKTEKFTSAGPHHVEKANAMLFREYRKGFDIQAG
jgi:predicted dehydrogenase